jgi:CelD/BcsL family acetyltransferase involved in cellulose biosynthesis
VSNLIVKRLDSLDHLRREAQAWDDLWLRSEITLPTARAELVALWCESFTPRQPFSAYVVEQNGRMVAALPLIAGRRLGLGIGTLPGSQWSPAGDLLLDTQSDACQVLKVLLRALQESDWPLLEFAAVPSGTERWQLLRQALDTMPLPHATRRRCTVNRVQIGHDWPTYWDSRSRSHRRHIRRSAARAELQGTAELECFDALEPADVEPLLRSCFEMEARGWKGTAQSAVLKVPGVWEFYLRQARQLAAWGQLDLVLLKLQGRPIAFEYGWHGKGDYFSPKVGYDETFHQLSPGQLLRYRLLDRFHERRAVNRVDFLGPESDATSKWATERYDVDQILVSLCGGLGCGLVWAYRHGWPLKRRVHSFLGRPPAARPLTSPNCEQERESIAVG